MSNSTIDFPRRMVKKKKTGGTKMLQQALTQVIDQNRQEKEASKTPEPGEESKEAEPAAPTGPLKSAEIAPVA